MIGSYIDLGNPMSSHPLNRGTTGFYLTLPNAGGLNVQDISGRRASGVLTGGPVWGDGRPGGTRSVAFTPAVDRFIACGLTDTLFPVATECSVCVLYRKRDTTNRASSLFGHNGITDANRVGAHAPYSDGTVYFDYAGSAGGTTRVSVGGLTFGTRWNVFVFTVGGGLGMRIYFNGNLAASNAATPTRTLGGSTWSIGRGNGESTCDAMNFGAVQVFPRALTSGEVRTWTDDAFRGFPLLTNRWSRRVYSFGQAAAPGGTNRRRRLLMGGR